MTTSVAPQDADTISDHPLGEPRPLRAIVIGAGASGLNFAYAVQRHLRNVEIVLYEKNNAVGGTWLENRWVSRTQHPPIFTSSSRILSTPP